MKHLLLSLLLLPTFFGQMYAQTKHYVKQNASGDGSSWANASGDLQAIINEAAAGDSIFVAGGTYLPDRSADNLTTIDAADRNDAFVLKKDVMIYGGFAGTETSLSQRILTTAANVSTLSGDIGTANDSTDNAYHVVVSAGDAGTATLDGFTVTGGNADGNGTIRVDNMFVYNNRAGGVALISSSPVINDVIVSNNSAAYVGGGISIESSSSAITNSVFIADNSQYGGAVYAEGGGAPLLSNVIICRNTATMQGGGIYNGASMRLINTTVSGNTANSAGGGICDDGVTSVLTNCILWDNIAGAEGGDEIFNFAQGSAILHHSLYEAKTNSINGSITATDNNLTADPRFTDSADGNYRLQVTSPAINAGINDSIPANDTLDFAGNPRIYDKADGGIADIGAYEYQVNPIHPTAGVLYVDSSAAWGGDGSSWAKAFFSFGDALTGAKTINAAATVSTDSVRQIWVAKGTYQPAGGQSFSMLPKVKIYGSFAGTETSLAGRNLTSGDTSILLGNGASVIRNDNNGLDTSVLLDGFKITKGNAAGNDLGGGIYNNEVSPTLSRLSITDNTSSVSGGGIYNNVSSPVLADVIIGGNTSNENGGGIYNSSSNPTLSNVAIIGNTAKTGNGGGMFNDASSSVLRNVTISGNRAYEEGGGILNITGSLSILTNSIVWGNTANSSSGNEISNVTGTVILHYSLYGNRTNDIYGEGTITGTDNDLTVSPQFADSADGNYRLAEGSPAINAGINDSVPSNDTLDLAGNVRIVGAAVDMGAYEFQNGGTTLPVTIKNFTGSLQNGTAVLQWQSGVESNFNHYEVEKSADGKTFAYIASVQAAGSNSSYTYKTLQSDPTAYYRLKAINDDGTSAYYAKIISLSQSGNAESIMAYPNPARSYINIKVVATGSIGIYDALGRLIKKQAIQAGVNKIDVSNLSTGVYFAEVNGRKVQFIKQ